MLYGNTQIAVWNTRWRTETSPLGNVVFENIVVNRKEQIKCSSKMDSWCWLLQLEFSSSIMANWAVFQAYVNHINFIYKTFTIIIPTLDMWGMLKALYYVEHTVSSIRLTNIHYLIIFILCCRKGNKWTTVQVFHTESSIFKEKAKLWFRMAPFFILLNTWNTEEQ